MSILYLATRLFIMTTENKLISVCICTFKRPHLLWRLLSELDRQRTDGLFSYSVVVVDNDRRKSAEHVVQSFQQVSTLAVQYCVEPEQNIALARNRALQNAKGDFIAFIDDDEFPDHAWLLNLYKTFIKSNVHGVLGPVKPVFQTDPPRWIIKGKLCERSSFETGVILNKVKYTRTGNVLLHPTVFKGMEHPFDPRFGISGGEDSVFFKTAIEKGYIFVWCNEACVYETIPPERLRRSYFLKRAFLRGMGESRVTSVFSFSTIKSLIAIALFSFSLPLLFLIGHHLFMKYLIKDCDHLGKILGLCGLKYPSMRVV